jgi:hypothetical protein
MSFVIFAIFTAFSDLTLCLSESAMLSRNSVSWEHRLTQKILVLATRTFFMRASPVFKYSVPLYNYFQMKFKLCSAKVLHHVTV